MPKLTVDNLMEFLADHDLPDGDEDDEDGFCGADLTDVVDMLVGQANDTHRAYQAKARELAELQHKHMCLQKDFNNVVRVKRRAAQYKQSFADKLKRIKAIIEEPHALL